MTRARRTGRTHRTLAAAAAALALLLGGCASASHGPGPTATAEARTPLSQLDVLKDPASHDGPSTAVLPAAAIAPVEKDPTPSLPATVTSHDPGGATVEVTVASDRRIVAFDLAGSIAGAVYGVGLGAHLVGRDVATTFPPADELPLVTAPDGQSVNAEAILALRPTVVLTDGTVGPSDVIQQLRDSGIPVVFVQNEASFAGAQQLARQVGAALGVPDAGAQLAERIGAQVTAEKAAIAKIAPSEPKKRLRMAFLYLRGQQGVYYLFGAGSGADALIDALDGIDVATQQGWGGMKPMTDEALVKMDPDLILVMTDGLKSVGGVDGLIAAKPAVGLTSAGRHHRFVDMADGEILSFGPRSADILDALARAIYAPGAS